MTRRKPQRGVCGVCGCAVVAPSSVELWSAVGVINGRVHGERRFPSDGWANGHEFADNGDLIQVLCPAHGGLGFPARAVGDATVPM